MSRTRLLLSCLFGLFLLFFGPVASSWALDLPVCGAPTQGEMAVDLAEECEKYGHPGAMPGLDDAPMGDPPIVLNCLSLAIPRLRQALNTHLVAAQAAPPPQQLHKPPSA
jgi:hypothetical protein